MELNGVRFACDCHSTITYHIDHFLVYASAPDLLELLKDILTWDGILPHSKVRIKQAIAEAEGI